MNSCLQCLRSSEILSNYFLNEDHLQEISLTFSAFGKLLKVMWKDSFESSVSPTEFKGVIEKWAPRFCGYRFVAKWFVLTIPSQHDSQEFLRFLLDGLHEDLNRITEKAPYQEEVFGDDEPEVVKAEKAWKYHLGFHNSFVFGKNFCSCDTCMHESVCFDPFLDLSVPIPKASVSPKDD